MKIGNSEAESRLEFDYPSRQSWLRWTSELTAVGKNAGIEEIERRSAGLKPVISTAAHCIELPSRPGPSETH